ncbi:YceK/YidQ family lipoprotein [Saccharobesus litoralis]|uniref:YceK/YidQ family lipoprotein n=1 Tax=Saccharobesus litoralis TaxID=2172099 RepID=A0A2S0VQ97_9ALTE|nr:YceK/YidQ family lipoprotein [Saccharobesus litoralis]AWB66388.1 YceK/YidQ family lipoprotein [Saccharobesus litoralis]
MHKLKVGLAILPLVLLASCATVKTINPPQNQVRIEHYGSKSYCKSIPRVYSGLAYNVCLMYGEPNIKGHTGSALNGVPFFIIDSAFSLVADTVVIPYTASQQAIKGNIRVN